MMILKISCGLFLIYYCLISSIIPSTATLLTPICGIMMAIVVFYLIRRGHFMLDEITFPIGSWMIFGIMAIISSYFTAKNTSLALDSAFTFIKLTAMCFCVVYISKETDNYDFFIGVMYIVSLIYILFMIIHGSLRGTRLALGNANSDANVCLIGIVTGSLITKQKESNQIRNFLVYGSIAFFAYVNLMTGSRKSFICLALYIVGWIVIEYSLLWKRHDINAYISVILLMVICIIIIMSIVLPIIYNSSTYSRITSDTTTEEQEIRINLYKEAWGYFKQSPLFGIGYNQFRIYNAQGIYSHSTYAEILSNCGIVGMLLFFAPHVWCIRNLIKIIKEKKEKKGDIRTASLIFVYFISTLILATGMVQTNNERILLMYSFVFSYIICEKQRYEREKSADNSDQIISRVHSKYIKLDS